MKKNKKKTVYSSIGNENIAVMCAICEIMNKLRNGLLVKYDI